jgi:hypothetical protein
MKRHLLAALALACTGLLAGCDSLSSAADRVREKIAERDEPQVRDYPAPPRATYEAVRVAADQMGFRFLHGGPAQGHFDAVSGVGLGEVPGSARQISMKVRLSPTSEGGTEVTVVLKEIKEADSSNRAGIATETPLRDTPLYDTFLRSVQRALDAKKAG